ncbi:hypothetical protein LCGC14_0606160 [marine sediment metagenome]|uniref:Uncharacterized protein n=1 Tax=marine sediment metagenome TaxID=412755 RepID=A0A0F9RDW4_9ZZZZ
MNKLTEDQSGETAEVKEKEEKRKIRVISEIDDLLGIQGQAYMKGQLKEALEYAEQIIDLATPENLQSFIREQRDLIAKIKGIQEEREEKERIRLRKEQIKLKLERIKKLKTELQQLEGEFNEVFQTEDFLKASEIIENAKILLSKLDNEKIKNIWDDLEKKCSDAKIRREIVKIADELIEESPELKKEFQFDDLKLRLSYLIQQTKEKGIADYLKKLKGIKADVLSAEKVYIKTSEKIEDLVNKIRNFKKNKKFQEAISNCEALIESAKSINKTKMVEEYSQILTQLREALKFEELKNKVQILNKDGIDLLKKGGISSSLEKFKLIKESITQYLELF